MSSDQPEAVGRTWVDVFYLGRWWFLAILVIIGLVLLVVFEDSVSGLAEAHGEDIKSLAVGAVAGFIASRWVTNRFLRVPTMDFLVLDFQNMTGDVWSVPVPRMKEMKVNGGNNLVFSWGMGFQFKLARKVDPENNEIEVAWPHEVPIEQAAITLSALQQREEDYTRCKIENLFLRRYPRVIAGDIARGASESFARDVSEMLRIDDFDTVSYIDGLDPLRVKHPMDRSDVPDEGGEASAAEPPAE